MKPSSFIATLTLLACLAAGCEEQKTTTPPAISERFHALLDTMHAETPGASSVALESLLQESEGYTIADSVEKELERLRVATEGRYRVARALARDGEFDLAESILQDLARMSGTDDGESARQHMDFEFYLEKARWLLVHQRFEEATEVARELQSRDLNPLQVNETEKILDYTGLADDAMVMTAHHNARNACKQLIVYLATIYVDNGTYPSSFSIADMEQMDQYGAKAFTKAIASIEEYKASQDHYSLVAVGNDGERYRIVDGELKN